MLCMAAMNPDRTNATVHLAIEFAADAGNSVADIAAAVGYTDEHVRQILGINPDMAPISA